MGCTVGFRAILDQRLHFTTLDENWIAIIRQLWWLLQMEHETLTSKYTCVHSSSIPQSAIINCSDLPTEYSIIPQDVAKRPSSIFQYSNMALRLSGENCNFFEDSFVSQFPKETCLIWLLKSFSGQIPLSLRSFLVASIYISCSMHEKCGRHSLEVRD